MVEAKNRTEIALSVRRLLPRQKCKIAFVLCRESVSIEENTWTGLVKPKDSKAGLVKEDMTFGKYTTHALLKVIHLARIELATVSVWG